MLGGRVAIISGGGPCHRRPRRAGLAAAGMLVLTLGSCASARPIVHPAEADRLPAAAAAANFDELAIKAEVLDTAQCERLLRVTASERDLLPVLFAIRNGRAGSLPIRQDDFRLRLAGGRSIAPALPGRAAAMLRDTQGSTQAMWAGYAVFGALAAPSIHSAEKKERAAVQASRALIFSSAEIAPGETAVGYLIFESPLSVDELPDVVLDWRALPGATMSLRLANPYAE